MNTNEPVTVAGAINAAILATTAVLALVLSWDASVVAAVNIALSAWIIVIALVVRSVVTPTKNVALTEDQAATLAALPPGELDQLR